MMKKFLSLGFLCLIFSLSSCGSDESNDEINDDNNPDLFDVSVTLPNDDVVNFNVDDGFIYNEGSGQFILVFPDANSSINVTSDDLLTGTGRFLSLTLTNPTGSDPSQLATGTFQLGDNSPLGDDGVVYAEGNIDLSSPSFAQVQVDGFAGTVSISEESDGQFRINIDADDEDQGGNTGIDADFVVPMFTEFSLQVDTELEITTNNGSLTGFDVDTAYLTLLSSSSSTNPARFILILPSSNSNITKNANDRLEGSGQYLEVLLGNEFTSSGNALEYNRT
jgi:hypothetical protein